MSHATLWNTNQSPSSASFLLCRARSVSSTKGFTSAVQAAWATGGAQWQPSLFSLSGSEEATICSTKHGVKRDYSSVLGHKVWFRDNWVNLGLIIQETQNY